MKQLACEMCGSTDLIKKDGVFVCQYCGAKYSVEEAKKMMVEIEGTVEVQGTVKVDNSAFVEKYLANARRAYEKEDWEEVEKYYNMVEQNTTNNMEAVFFSAYGKAMLSLTDDAYHKREQKFNVLNNSISVINDYFELTNEDKESVLNRISSAIEKMYKVKYVYNYQTAGYMVGGKPWQENLFNRAKKAFVKELNEIAEKHKDAYIQNLITRMNGVRASNGCYVATCVYGSYDCPQVWTLRRFRDDTLGATWHGRAFIRAYYAISPTLVKWFGKTTWFKRMWQGTLDKMVASLNSKGVADTPYQDKNWR